VDWIDMTQDRDKRQDVVKEVMDNRVPKYTEYFLSSWRTVRF